MSATVAQPPAAGARLRRGLALACLALAGVAGSALAFSAVWPEAEAPAPQRLSAADAAAAHALVRRAQALVDVEPADVGYRLRVEGPLPGVRGRIDTESRTITLFVAPGSAAHRVAHDLAHEIGHAVDTARLTAAQRAAWLRARRATGAAWWPSGGTSDYRTGAGDFAEVFALCHAASPDFRSRLAIRPSDACRLLPAAAAAVNLRRGAA